jgi:hypothetical protein
VRVFANTGGVHTLEVRIGTKTVCTICLYRGRPCNIATQAAVTCFDLLATVGDMLVQEQLVLELVRTMPDSGPTHVWIKHWVRMASVDGGCAHQPRLHEVYARTLFIGKQGVCAKYIEHWDKVDWFEDAQAITMRRAFKLHQILPVYRLESARCGVDQTGRRVPALVSFPWARRKFYWTLVLVAARCSVWRWKAALANGSPERERQRINGSVQSYVLLPKPRQKYTCMCCTYPDSCTECLRVRQVRGPMPFLTTTVDKCVWNTI